MESAADSTKIAEGRRERRAVRLILLALAAVLTAGFGSLLSPQLAIRADLLLKLHPQAALLAEIRQTHIVYRGMRYYGIDRGRDRQTGNSLNGFYVRKVGPLHFVKASGAP
ncbi:hypothetical protein HGI30_22240 [Paenibacillus albicereus]|uniref:Uncharacterized protein n=1 Tax=Paenibacillus albicereus TaxID=2726185 RepID=A0A6H2H2U2_9BACL|nr:hypothetical protein [Paenibacillus albicereus]QJC53977.1 hypothetical protein HGI30_22240 [Paenibacillus albicereus]